MQESINTTPKNRYVISNSDREADLDIALLLLIYTFRLNLYGSIYGAI